MGHDARGGSDFPAAMSAVLQDHINTVVSPLPRHSVFAWDVVNEALSDSQTGTGVVLKDSIWYNQPGIGATGHRVTSSRRSGGRVAADPERAAVLQHDYNVGALRARSSTALLRDGERISWRAACRSTASASRCTSIPHGYPSAAHGFAEGVRMYGTARRPGPPGPYHRDGRAQSQSIRAETPRPRI